MNQRVKNLWVEALTNGTYQQATRSLRNSEGYCCLGVLCDLYLKENKEKEWSYEYNHWRLDGKANILPSFVMEWAGLKECNPKIIAKHSLVSYNDEGMSFTQLAELIEEYL